MAARGNGCNDDCRRAAGGRTGGGIGGRRRLDQRRCRTGVRVRGFEERCESAGGILFGALRAETVKIGLAVLLLWLVLANYAEAQVGVLATAFVTTMLIFGMAFFVREY